MRARSPSLTGWRYALRAIAARIFRAHGDSSDSFAGRHVKILFVCIKNSSRSPMAEALLKMSAKRGVEVCSAGIKPGSEVNDQAVKAMHEIGYNGFTSYELCHQLPVVNGKLAISGRLGENLSVKEGQEAARIASLNALAAAKHHLGTLDRLKKLVKLTVLIATTEQFVDHPPVADGASNLFVQIFGPEAGHTRSVIGVQSLPIGAPVIVESIFEIEPNH